MKLNNTLIAAFLLFLLINVSTCTRMKLQRKTKDLNQWGVDNCEFKNEQEEPGSFTPVDKTMREKADQDKEEVRYFATSLAHNGCGGIKGTPPKKKF